MIVAHENQSGLGQKPSETGQDPRRPPYSAEQALQWLENARNLVAELYRRDPQRLARFEKERFGYLDKWQN